jgi:stress response protein SCP2
MTTALNSVAIRRLNKVSIRSTKTPATQAEFAAFFGNLSRLGYCFSGDALPLVQKASVKNLEEILTAARHIKGDATYKPMYPNFPDQVATTTDLELYVVAMLHYVSVEVGLMWLPAYEPKRRTQLMNPVQVMALGVADEKDFRKLAEDLVVQGQPFSVSDLGDLDVLRKWVKPAEVGVKENVATLLTLFPELDWSASVKTATDVLRLAAALSGGDVSLAENTKFKLSRADRRLVAGLLEKVLIANHGVTEDLARHEEKWKRLAKTLHVGELKLPNAMAALDALYKGNIKSFDSVVEILIEKKDVLELIKILGNRPGIFARRLGELIAKMPNDRKYFVKAFGNVSDSVSIPVLVQMWNFYSGPTSDVLPKRFVQYKSRNQLTGVVDNKLVGDYSDVVAAIEAGLKDRHADKKIFVDAELADQFAVPLGIRSASSGSRVIGRGSRIKFSKDEKAARFFMHWKNMPATTSVDSYLYGHGEQRVDLDLSVLFVSEDFQKRKQVSYTNLREEALKTYHSGDITDAPNGAAEFIDVDIEAALKGGYRYVAMSIYGYTRQKLSQIPEAWAGVMLRKDVHSGEVFEPSTVTQRYDLTVDNVNSTPLMFDLKTRELIWWDSSVQLNESSYYSLAENMDGATLAAKSLALSKVMSVGELLKLTSAVVVDSEKKADIVLDPAATEQVLGLVN